MEERPVCPSCKQPLAPNTPMGLCPACLIQSGFRTGTEPGTAPGTGSSFEPPPVEEIARRFPQLEVIALIGRGGMGAVYQARQRQLERLVALKILPVEPGREPSFAERFAREAKALARLNHPNIVSVYDCGQQEGLYYFIMEYVDGVNLRQLERSRRPTPEQALAIVPAICDALQYAHQQGIVHRDIKPENILLDKQGRVKIADFGIAKILRAGNQGAALTQGRGVVGTPNYMAPEQVEKPGSVDHRADIYSLGVVFYEMLTGELPLGKFAPPSQKVHVDVRLDEVVLHALEKEPERRYQQASEVKTDLETITTTQIQGGRVGRGWPKLQRPSLSVFLGILIVALLSCLLGLELRSKRLAKPAAPPVPVQSQVQVPEQSDVSPEEVRKVSVDEWFDRFGQDAKPGEAPFAPLRALIEKAKESDATRTQILRQASEAIDDPGQTPFKRWQCCYVLSGIGDPQGIPALTRALKDKEQVVRGVAACALGAFDQPEAKSALEEAGRTEQSAEVQQWIRKALDGEFRRQSSPTAEMEKANADKRD